MMKYDALASLGAAGIMDIDALAQWISKSFSRTIFYVCRARKGL